MLPIILGSTIPGHKSFETEIRKLKVDFMVTDLSRKVGSEEMFRLDSVSLRFLVGCESRN